ncbi:branched-chain amino acid aminotransferase [Cytophagales bacterium LB-30]|uniref:branched-chain-amino-acid transaminase n=1 Tax=Shiella aurantiaca TaxID=3058365 RepID=A0ABT8FAB3_9BACT|nr:branched-chain amino acid aminotransferase [Shiella aurantiaca]MDN4166911.1 branched-chain amino acid aminotransferase [Shiella aurantiaca]
MTDTLSMQIKKVNQSRISEVDFDNIAFGKVYSDHMFMADYKDGEWTNLQVLPYEHLRLSPANSAIHYGQSIFEGLKAYRSPENEILLFRPMDNWARLNRSAARMCMPEVPEEVFMSGLQELLKLDNAWVPSKIGSSLYIRPFMFATDEYIGIRPSDTYKFMIFTCPVGSYYSEPVRVRIETNYSRAYTGGTGFAKCAGNYAGALYPAKQAQKLGYHQLIWTDASSHQYIEESGTMNVMFLINDTLITAPTGDTILDGITRKSVLTLAREWGVKVEERKVSILEVVEAIKNGTLKEAFGTGTAATIAPIALLNHDGVDYTLPAIETREFSNKILKTLNDIRYGIAPDTHNWITKL